MRIYHIDIVPVVINLAFICNHVNPDQIIPGVKDGSNHIGNRLFGNIGHSRLSIVLIQLTNHVEIVAECLRQTVIAFIQQIK
ncbi:hypothetical protein D3C81_1614360 [compost metagenome]